MSANLRGNNVSSASPSSGQVLAWDGTQWAPATSGGGITQLTDDVVAGPGSGSQTSTIHEATGQPTFSSGGNVVFSHAQIYFTGGSVPQQLIRLGGANENASIPVLSASGLDAAIGNLPGGSAYGYPLSTFSLNANQFFFYTQGTLAIQSTATPAGGRLWAGLVGRLDAKIETFTTDFTTDTGPYNVNSSLVLEANLPPGHGGKTLTIRSNPQGQSGPTTFYGRILYVADVAGTLDPLNPLTIVDADGRTFLVEGSAPLASLVLTTAYASRKLRLTGNGASWTVGS
jgi:hypothetical protein